MRRMSAGLVFAAAAGPAAADQPVRSSAEHFVVPAIDTVHEFKTFGDIPAFPAAQIVVLFAVEIAVADSAESVGYLACLVPSNSEKNSRFKIYSK